MHSVVNDRVAEHFACGRSVNHDAHADAMRRALGRTTTDAAFGN